MSEDITPTNSPTLTAQLKEGTAEERLAYFLQVFTHANAWAIQTQGEEAQNIINANEHIKNTLLSGHVGLCIKCEEPTNELFMQDTDTGGVEDCCLWCAREQDQATKPSKTAFIHTLPLEQQDSIREALQEQGIEHDALNDAMESRLSDVAHLLEEEAQLCVCADCGSIVPQWTEDTHHDGLKDWAKEHPEHPTFCGHWADCPNCGTDEDPIITGVEFCSCFLPNGAEFDHQFHLRHFPESYEPTQEEYFSCLIEEAEQARFDRLSLAFFKAQQEDRNGGY